MTASIIYDKTVFKPASVSKIGRFGFQVSSDSEAGSDEQATPNEEAPEASTESTESASSMAGEEGSKDTAGENSDGSATKEKSEFEFGDLSPTDESAATDELPKLESPASN